MNWLAQSGGSLAITTYQAGKVATLGWNGRQVTLMMRDFDKPLGLAVRGRQMALAVRHGVWQFSNDPPLAYEYLEGQPGRYDALYLPRICHHTGDLHIHDLAYDEEGLLLVNTRFSCLARLSPTHSFEPVWRPKFITDLVPEDRCHLNGLAMKEGRAAYVTALGTTDEAGGWRTNKAQGGVLIDVESGETVLDGLSMPHSPRWYNGALWLLNSGTGEVLLVDPASGRRQTVCELPGYLRGLCFVGPYAVVGMSKIREKHIFGGLPIQQKHKQLRCGVTVIDLRTGAPAGSFEFTSGCTEMYDAQFLSGVARPMILNAEKEASRQAITNPESSYWLRASSEIKEEERPSSEAASAAVPSAGGQPGVETFSPVDQSPANS